MVDIVIVFVPLLHVSLFVVVAGLLLDFAAAAAAKELNGTQDSAHRVYCCTFRPFVGC